MAEYTVTAWRKHDGRQIAWKYDTHGSATRAFLRMKSTERTIDSDERITRLNMVAPSGELMRLVHLDGRPPG